MLSRANNTTEQEAQHWQSKRRIVLLRNVFFSRTQSTVVKLIISQEYEIVGSATAGLTRKPSYRKDDRTMRHTYECPENCRESLTIPTATFPEVFNGLFLRLML